MHTGLLSATSAAKSWKARLAVGRRGQRGRLNSRWLGCFRVEPAEDPPVVTITSARVLSRSGFNSVPATQLIGQKRALEPHLVESRRADHFHRVAARVSLPAVAIRFDRCVRLESSLPHRETVRSLLNQRKPRQNAGLLREPARRHIRPTSGNWRSRPFCPVKVTCSSFALVALVVNGAGVFHQPKASTVMAMRNRRRRRR